MSNIPKKSSIWYHFKHDPSKGVYHMAYEIVGIAVNTSTEELMVVYKALYDVAESGHVDRGEDFYTRPLSEWEELKDWKGEKVARFCEIIKS